MTPQDERRFSLGLLVSTVAAIVRFLFRTPAKALRGSARRVADPARQVLDYWVSERATMRQGFTAVSLASVTSLVAGLTLAALAHRLDEVPGLLVLIPASIGMRGAIFGALSARLGTAIHTGLFEVSRNREGVLAQNVHGAMLLTVSTSATMAVLARAVTGLLGLPSVSLWDLMAVAMVGGLLSSAVVLAATVALSAASFRRSWDLDSVGAPIITAMGDFVTLPFLLAASYLVGVGYVTEIVGALALVAALGSIIQGWTATRDLTRRIARESLPVLTAAITLDVLAGAVVEPRVEHVFDPYPALLIILPGFLANTGALGSILAARLGSKLHLGAVTPRARPEPAALLDGTIVIALGVAVYTFMATLALLLSLLMGFGHPGTATFLGVVVSGGILATLVGSLIGYYAATVTYRFGWDPDNHTIPLVTSSMDLLGAICLIAALVVFGVA